MRTERHVLGIGVGWGGGGVRLLGRMEVEG